MPRENDSLLIAKSDFSCTVFILSSSMELEGRQETPITICVLAILMALSTTMTNVLVISSVWRTPGLHSPSIIFLVGLAFSDLSVGLVVLPLVTLSNIAKVIQAATLFCKAKRATSICGIFLCNVSMLTLTAIKTDRYMAIHYHLRYQEIVTLKRVQGTITFSWVLAGAPAAFYAVGSRDLLTASLTGFLFLSLAIFALTNFLIRRILVKRHEKSTASQMQVQIRHTERSFLNLPRFKKSLRNTQILLWAFFLCYLPHLIMTGIISATGLTPLKQSLSDFCTLLICFNSLLNPLIYCWRYGPIQPAISKLVRDLLCKNPSRNWENHPRAGRSQPRAWNSSSYYAVMNDIDMRTMMKISVENVEPEVDGHEWKKKKKTATTTRTQQTLQLSVKFPRPPVDFRALVFLIFPFRF